MSKKILQLLTLSSAAIFSASIYAQTIVGDLFVVGSVCAGLECSATGEFTDFDFDTLRLRSDTPVILFNDTSSSVSFPSNDWAVGSSTGLGNGMATFFIEDRTATTNMLQIEPGQEGGIAIGADSTLEAGAVSVGSPGSERQLVHLAPGLDATDAVNKAQFDVFTTSADALYAEDRTELDTLAADLQNRMTLLANRLEALAVAIDSGTSSSSQQ